MNDNTVHLWRPFEGFQETLDTKFALVILNQPIPESLDNILVKLWENSAVRLCADGGFNQLAIWEHKMQKHAKEKIENISILPDYVCGDLDSIDLTEVCHSMEKGTKFFQLNNQDMTDFHKTLRFAVNCVRNKEIDQEIINHNIKTEFSFKSSDVAELVQTDFEQIYSICDIGGRTDHCIGNFNTLYRDTLVNFKIYLVSSESMTFLLKKGINIIYIDDELHCGQYCGFFPLGCPAIITTYGLKYNVYNKQMKFGSFVSSSNEFNSNITTEEKLFIESRRIEVDLGRNHVIIETDNPLLWTMSIK